MIEKIKTENEFTDTKRAFNVEDRIKQLSSSTSSPFDFEFVESFFCLDVVFAESEIHRSLDEFRPNKSKEFFQVDEKLAISICKSIIGR